MAPVAEVLADPAFRMMLAADPVAVREALARIAASGPMAALSADHRATAEIVLAEVLNNIAEHAYAGAAGDIAIILRTTPAGLACQLSDQGREMPGGSPPLGILPEEEFPEGGFGWYLIRSLTQGLTYQRKAGQNLLHFVIPA